MDAAATKNVDKDWFLQKLREKRSSVRKLAKHLEIDPSAVSRALSGQRKIRIDEATNIAKFLGVTVSEVLNHTGVYDSINKEKRNILLAAEINKNGQIVNIPNPKPLSSPFITRAHAAISWADNHEIIAAQIRASDGPLVMFDDAIVLFRPSEQIELDAIGFLAICRSRRDEQIMARIERARKTGEALIIRIDGKADEVTLETATPVLAIIP